MKYTDTGAFWKTLMLAVFLLVSKDVMAQEIADIPSDPAFKSGVLPNGMRWYVAVNPNVKGIADFALVQNTGLNNVPGVAPDSIIVRSQRVLAARFTADGASVQKFFSRKGCVPGPEGFAQVRDDATVYRFRKINLLQSASVMDSTLFVIMNMAGASEEVGLQEWYAPADQAIVVSGDVDPDVVAQKLQMLSYMLPASASRTRNEYSWKDSDSLDVKLEPHANPDVAKVTLSWRLKRIPRELMSTAMPAIYGRYMTMGGLVHEERITNSFMEQEIPAISVKSSYSDGAGMSGDESFSVSVTVFPQDLSYAVKVLAASASALDRDGAYASEILKAGRRYADMLYQADHGSNVANGEYVERCVSSFIYNSPLCSIGDIRRFHESRSLPDSTECRLFNSILSASMEGGRNLSLKLACGADGQDAQKFADIFASAWASAEKEAEPGHQRVSYRSIPETKVKVKSIRNEYLSEGTVWTLTNGIRVMVKKMPAEKDMIHYSLSLNRGSGNVEGLDVTDGRYLADYFLCSRVGGVAWKNFEDDVRRHGMTLGCRIGNSATEFKGMVPTGRLAFLFRALQTMIYSHEPDPDQWTAYMRTEPLRKAALVSTGETPLDEGFAEKAGSFFDEMSKSMNNGVIVLVGDIDEKELKEVLMTYGGGFITSERAFSRVETQTRNRTAAGASAKIHDKGMDVVITAPLALTSENYYVAAMSVMALRHHLAMTTAGKGIRSGVSHEFKIYPQENIVLKISLDEVTTSGLAAGTESYEKGAAYDAVRQVLSDMSAIDISGELLASCRYRLEKYLLLEQERPEYWINALNLRYLAGKDFTTGAQERIKGVDADDVRRLLSSVGKNCKVEYIITGE